MLTPTLNSLALRAAHLLRARGETVALAEGSAGGLVSASLLSLAGASAYYLGGVVVYTAAAHRAFIAGAVDVPPSMRGATEAFAQYIAQSAQIRLGATWGVGEAGAAGPPNPYGDPAGHVWLAVTGPVNATRHVLTGSDVRVDNMIAFAEATLELFVDTLEQASA
jgi:PncC family amidohydrolase